MAPRPPAGLSSISSRRNGGRCGRHSSRRPLHRDRPPTDKPRGSGYAVVAGIGAVRSLVLAVGVWIELRTVAGIVDYLLRGRRRCDRSGKEAATPSKANFVMGILLKG